MAALQKFKLLATQCGVTQSPTRSPRTSPLVQLRRRKTTLRMLLTRSTGRRSPRRRESLAYQLRPEPLPEKRNERESQSEKVLAPPRPSLKDLFVSSPPFEGERGRDDNFKERGFGGENRELGLVCKGIYGSSTGWQYGPGSPRPVWTGLRYKSLLRRAWRPVLVTIPES
ncbi:uncharacterized protein LOC107413337 [Ziziphus jujuba]|uniref:Uncharacterized protein LOC107413337 n=2 Tax=Ziziphus jujuba TaxID=326968 RepID=A0A6P6FZZ8_ZIZJJ|nr:uncharacterized protein LOC107413337 [Ziziphus jujuba]KAH7516475.1 hypothetical protein FEM48_Zijuj10G0139100 [Ziziphus jujuba var. spinosa]